MKPKEKTLLRTHRSVFLLLPGIVGVTANNAR